MMAAGMVTTVVHAQPAASIAAPHSTNKAQTWAVVPLSSVPPEANLLRLTEMVESDLSRSSLKDLNVLPATTVQTRVLQAAAVPVKKPDPALLDRMDDVATETLDHLIYGRDHEALDLLLGQGRERQGMLQEVMPYLSWLGQSPLRAAQITNLCLYGTRALLHLSQSAGSKSKQARAWEDKAREHTRQCFQLVPDLLPDQSLHGMEIRRLVESVRTEIQQQKTSVLVVNAPNISDSCAFRINGRKLSEAPRLVLHVPPGRYYVQLDCADNRIRPAHPMTVGLGPLDFSIDDRLSPHIRQRPQAWIHETRQATLPQDVLAVLHGQLQAKNIITVELLKTMSHARLRRYVFSGRQAMLVAEGRLSFSAEGYRFDKVHTTVDALVKGKSIDATGQTAVPFTLSNQERGHASDASAAARAHASPAVAVSMATVALTMTAAGYIVAWSGMIGWSLANGSYQNDAPDTSDYYQRRENMNTYETLILAGGVMGASAAIPLSVFTWLALDDPPEGWLWLSAAVGTALLASGIVLLAMDDACSTGASPCTHPRDTNPLGTLLSLQSAPFLSVPLTLWLRRAFDGSGSNESSSTVSLRIERHQATLGLSGKF